MIQPSCAVPTKAEGKTGTIIRTQADQGGWYYLVAVDSTPEDIWEDLLEDMDDLSTFTLGHRLPKVFPGDRRLVLNLNRSEMKPLDEEPH